LSNILANSKAIIALRIFFFEKAKSFIHIYQAQGMLVEKKCQYKDITNLPRKVQQQTHEG
jgi:hypothetical protein